MRFGFEFWGNFGNGFAEEEHDDLVVVVAGGDFGLWWFEDEIQVCSLFSLRVCRC